jgi:putative redox protein
MSRAGPGQTASKEAAMGARAVTVTLVDDRVRFEAVVGGRHRIVLDDAEGDAGPRPAELLGAALGACTAMDVVSILRKKQQPVGRYEVRVTALQAESHPRAFVRFDVVHVLDGDGMDPEAVRRSIELSARKYCAVGATLASGALEIHHAYLLRDTDGDERYAEVLVIGPGREPDDPPDP